MEKTNLCIIVPIKNAYSETFIKNHIQYLDFNKIIIYGTGFNDLTFNNNYLVPQYFFNRFLQKITGQFFSDKNWLVKLKLKQILKKNRINACLAEYGPSGVLVTDICEKLKIPLIVHFHGYDASVKSVLDEYKESYLKMFHKAKAIIAVSSTMVVRLKNLGAPNNKIVFNPYGIDIELFKPNLAKKEKTFVAIGRFVAKKAPHLTILAFYKAQQNCPNIRLKMIGDGPLWEPCKQLTKALKINNSIEFLGVMNSQEISKILSDSYAFLQHSVIAEDGNAEGTPLAILEACAAGIPVISTKHEGIMDVIKTDINGILVDEFNIDAMTHAIIKFASNDEYVTILSKNSRLMVEEKYSLTKSIDNLKAIISHP